MDRQIEIKGFIEFCGFLSEHPDEIGKSEELQDLLSFCYDSIKNCDCSKQTSSKVGLYEKIFAEKIQSISKDTKETLGKIFDKTNSFSSIILSTPINDNQVKIK